jgi:ribosome biogenesis GTPase A
MKGVDLMNENEENKEYAKTTISWYPGHMAKTKNEVIANINLIDVIFELVDARIPFSSKVQDFDKVLNLKRKVLIMTKSDLCDEKETRKWVKFYENKGYKVLQVNLNDHNVADKIMNLVSEYLNEINEKRNSKGLKDKMIKAAVIGIPNVGKSTLINVMAGKNVTRVGNIPGVTKNTTWLKTKYPMVILDTPGILWPKMDNQKITFNLAAIGSIKEELLPVNEVGYYILQTLDKYYPNLLEKYYGLTKLTDDYDADYLKIADKLNIKSKGGEIDFLRVNKFILNDIKQEKLKGITLDRGL